MLKVKLNGDEYIIPIRELVLQQVFYFKKFFVKKPLFLKQYETRSPADAKTSVLSRFSVSLFSHSLCAFKSSQDQLIKLQ